MQLINILDIKPFMQLLFQSNTLDKYQFVSATIQTDMTYSLDGHINHNFFSEEDISTHELTEATYLPWFLAKEKVFLLIKGKTTPTQLKVVLRASQEDTAPILNSTKSSLNPNDIDGLFINITFQENKLNVICGISYKILDTFDRMFYNCPKLEYVKLGRTCWRIGQEMFSGCTSLVSIQMPTLVREFGSNIFLNCANLKEITISITDDTYEIGWGLFRGCKALEVIRLDLSRIYSFAQFTRLEDRIKSTNIDDRYPRFRHFTLDNLHSIAVRHYDESYFDTCFKPFVDCHASWIIDALAHCEPDNNLINVEVTLGGYDDYKMVDAFNLATVIMNSNRIYYATELFEQQFGVFNPRGTYYLTTVRT